MTELILNFLIKLYGPDLLDEKLLEALSFKTNRKLAQIGDSVLDLIIFESAYRNPNSRPQSMDNLRQKEGKKEANQQILKKDNELTQYLLKNDYEQNPQGKIGKDRSDAYLEAIIGAIYLTKGLCESKKFIEIIYGLKTI